MAIQEDLTCGEGGSTGQVILDRVNTNHHNIGDLDTLTTNDKTSLVSALNEVDSKVDIHGTEITDLETEVGVHDTEIGDLGDLDTIEKNSLVGAINEVNAKVPLQRFEGAKMTAYAVPDTVGADALTLSVTGLIAGRYYLSYSFTADFQSHKDKPLAYQLTGDAAGYEFAITISTANVTEKVDHNYGYYVDLPDGDYSFGIVFKDVSGGQGFIIDYCDLMLMYLSPTP